MSRRSRWTLAAALGLVLGVFGTGFAGDEACTEAGPVCRGELALEGGGILGYYRSHPLERNPAIERAVLVVHGNRRDADRYFASAIAAADLEQRLSDTLIVAPSFRTLEDEPAPREHHWSSGGWKRGDRSRDPERISSFRVMNELVARVCAKEPGLFPGLRTVVIIGHSAGGQFVNRYAAGGTGCGDRPVDVRYVAMNPSSYLYVDARRKRPKTGGFAPPYFGCPKYDEYKYGLQDLNAYMKDVGVERIRAQLFSRRIYYVGGEDDVKTGGSLDTRCSANLQGPNRLARHRNYRDYSKLFEEWKGSVFLTVPGIGHSGRRMLASETVREITFR